MANFTPTPKQEQLIKAAFTPGIFELYYGGAAGGGKTYGALALLIALCKIYPGSRWAVVRRDRQKLVDNTLPKFRELVPPRFLMSFVNYTATFKNGSQIIFTGENFDKDKDLTKFDGFDVNGFLLEECQELQEKMYNKARLRAGRHILQGAHQPKKLIIMTGNPSQNFSKKLFYEPWAAGDLLPPRAFIPASMADNPYLDPEYVQSLETLDMITYERFVRGNWDIVDVGRPFAYGFDRGRHVRPTGAPNIALPLYVSFDFNVDPITALVCQHNQERTRIFIHREYRLRNSNIYELCRAIRRDFPKYYIYVTGDASGQNSSALVLDDLNYYRVIMQEMQLSASQIIVPRSNPGLGNSRVLTNSLLQRHPMLYIDPVCQHLIEDLLYCEVTQGGDLDKTRNARMTHLLDCFRYYLNTWFSDFVKYKI
jgi:hypothetical protein